MRRLAVLGLIAGAALSQMAMSAPQPGAAPAAQERPLPAACNPDAQGRLDFKACYEATTPGTPERSLAAINLGTQAFLGRDFATAVRFYDEAQPPGATNKVYSDPVFHAFRAAAFSHVGREAEALENARTALEMLRGQGWMGRAGGPPTGEQKTRLEEAVYANILPILHRAKDPGFAATLAAYKALPADDWIALANRAGVLDSLDDGPGAVADMDKALKLKPDEPGVLNNACYTYTRAGRAAEGLAYCERVVAMVGDDAAVRESYASALEALGRCDEARTQLAEARRLDPTGVAYRRELKCAAK